MLDEENNRANMAYRQLRDSQKNQQIEPTPKGSELPPEFQEFDNIVEQSKKKSVYFEQNKSSFLSIPEGQNMFKKLILMEQILKRLLSCNLNFKMKFQFLKVKSQLNIMRYYLWYNSVKGCSRCFKVETNMW